LTALPPLAGPFSTSSAIAGSRSSRLTSDEAIGLVDNIPAMFATITWSMIFLFLMIPASSRAYAGRKP
jgi:hypothetical protein